MGGSKRSFEKLQQEDELKITISDKAMLALKESVAEFMKEEHQKMQKQIDLMFERAAQLIAEVAKETLNQPKLTKSKKQVKTQEDEKKV